MSCFKVTAEQFHLNFITLASLSVDYTALKCGMLNVVYLNKIKYKSMSMGDVQGNCKFAFLKIMF